MHNRTYPHEVEEMLREANQQDAENKRIAEAVAAEREACTEFAERILLQHTQNRQGMTGDETEYEENTDAQHDLWKRGERREFSQRVSVAAYKLEEAVREACVLACLSIDDACPDCAAHNDHEQCTVPTKENYANAIRDRGKE